MERKRTNARKITRPLAIKIEKPSAFIPPPEARPRIISNIQIQPPPAHSMPPPPLSYLAPLPRRVRFAHNIMRMESPSSIIPTVASAQIPTPPVKLQSAPVQDAVPQQISAIDPTVSLPNATVDNNLAAANEGSTIPAIVKPKPPKPKFPKWPRFTEEQVFEGIRIYKPRRYSKHQQYLIKRTSLPPVKVTLLNRNFARIRCQGHNRVVEMVEN